MFDQHGIFRRISVNVRDPQAGMDVDVNGTVQVRGNFIGRGTFRATAGTVTVHNLVIGGTTTGLTGANVVASVEAKRASTNQSVAHASNTILVFNSEIKDTNAEYNPSTGLFTAGSTGRYMFNVMVGWGTLGYANAFATLFVRVGASLQNKRVSGPTTTDPVMNWSFTHDMTAAATAAIIAYHSNDSSAAVNMNFDSSWLMITRLT